MGLKKFIPLPLNHRNTFNKSGTKIRLQLLTLFRFIEIFAGRWKNRKKCPCADESTFPVIHPVAYRNQFMQVCL